MTKRFQAAQKRFSTLLLSQTKECGTEISEKEFQDILDRHAALEKEAREAQYFHTGRP